jgi:hypothetical protein
MTVDPKQAQAAVAESGFRSFQRNYVLNVYRTSAPKAGEPFLIQKEGDPTGESVNGLEIRDLRIQFEVNRDLSKHPNQCEIQITNLSPQNRAALEGKHIAVTLSAGYDGVNEPIYSGDVLFAMSEQDGADWVTKLQIADGGRTIRRARVNRSYPRGTSIKTALRDVAASMGQSIPDNIAASEELEQQCGSGLVLTGCAKEELSRLLAPFGFGWSFQSGKLQILRDEDVQPVIYEINEQNGLLSTPQSGNPPKSGKPPHVTLKSLLRPGIYPGAQVEVLTLRSPSKLYRVEKVKHTGDTFGDDWYTELDLKPVTSKKRAGAKKIPDKIPDKNLGAWGLIQWGLDYFRGGSSRGGGAGSSF